MIFKGNQCKLFDSVCLWTNWRSQFGLGWPNPSDWVTIFGSDQRCHLTSEGEHCVVALKQQQQYDLINLRTFLAMQLQGKIIQSQNCSSELSVCYNTWRLSTRLFWFWGTRAVNKLLRVTVMLLLASQNSCNLWPSVQMRYCRHKIQVSHLRSAQKLNLLRRRTMKTLSDRPPSLYKFNIRSLLAVQ